MKRKPNCFISLRQTHTSSKKHDKNQSDKSPSCLRDSTPLPSVNVTHSRRCNDIIRTELLLGGGLYGWRSMTLVGVLMHSHDCFFVTKSHSKKNGKNTVKILEAPLSVLISIFVVIHMYTVAGSWLQKKFNSLTRRHWVDFNASNQFLSGKRTQLKGINPDCVQLRFNHWFVCSLCQKEAISYLNTFFFLPIKKISLESSLEIDSKNLESRD